MDGEQPFKERFSVGANGSLTLNGELSFANYGMPYWTIFKKHLRNNYRSTCGRVHPEASGAQEAVCQGPIQNRLRHQRRAAEVLLPHAA